jgi:cytochrome c oxidase cbb3-type subunit 3
MIARADWIQEILRPALLLALAAAAVAQTPRNATEPPPARIQRGREFLGLGPAADAAAAERGAKLFSQSCAFCHGPKATGGEGPDLVRSSAVLHDEHGSVISGIVSKGRVDRGMPAFPSFSPDQLRDLAEFLHSRVEAAANRFGYKILNVVTGDAQAGKTFFEAHCVTCHSPERDLAHIAHRYEPADLQAQFLYPASSQQTQATVVVKHTDGASDSGQLVAIDDFTVTIRDANSAVRILNRDNSAVVIHDPLEGHRALLGVYTNPDMHNVLAYLETLQ